MGGVVAAERELINDMGGVVAVSLFEVNHRFL